MKNLIYILTPILIAFTSCESFLEEDLRSYGLESEFYATESGYASLINANYSALREIYGQDPMLFCAGTDLYREGRDEAPRGLARYSELNPSSEGVGFLYEKCFEAIQLANKGLYYNELTEQTSNIDVLRGELQFMRANAYFLLVQTYGGVSIIQDLIEEPILQYERNTAEEVYDLIISDLESAHDLVSTGEFNGRVTQRAVLHFLAKVHLTRAYETFGPSSDFATAAAYADQAIAGQPLDNDYASLWWPANEDKNDEVLFAVQFTEGTIGPSTNLLGNQQQNYFGSYLGGSEVNGMAPGKSNTLSPSRYALDLFVEGDTRWDATFMTVMYDRYFDYFDKSDAVLAATHVAFFYEPSWYTEADSLDFRNRPNVDENTVYRSYGTHDPDGAGSDVNNNFMTIVVKKFDDPDAPHTGAGLGSRTSTRDFVVARLGETYLIAAEAYLGAGDIATAQERLDAVRERAFESNPVPDPGPIDIDVILDERGRELLGEYHRWFDLKRTGKLVERASTYNSLVDESNFVGAGGNLKILRPIPQAALDLNQNKDFPQNPAYN